MHIDFETYSEAGYCWDADGQRWRGTSAKSGIAGVGSWVYTIHPSADLISLAYDGTVWIPGMPPPVDLFDYLAGGGLVWAWNSFFEFCAWNNIGCKRYGWPVLPLSSTRCAMARARAFGLPGKLEKAGAAIGLDDAHLKDPIGKSLIRKLTVPRSPTKLNQSQRLTPESNPEDFGKFYEYNLQDVVSESAICARTPPLLPHEERLWLLDQEINARGVHIDRAGLDDCISVFRSAEKLYTQELQDLTNGAVQTVNEVQTIVGWLKSQGVNTSSLDADHVTALLNDDIPGDCRRVLEIRQVLGSASVKKLFSLQRHMDPTDSRIRGIFAYCGAERTGRFSGMGPQPHNFPTSGPKVKQCSCGCVQYAKLPACRKCGGSELSESDWGIEAVELALADISTRSLSMVERSWGDPLTAISGCLRGLFTATEGKDFICSDYSAIEAVGLAALAGEEWRLEVFRTHGKIYEMSASKISGVPFEEILEYRKQHGQHHKLRKTLGKVSELASGYGGWVGAWKAFGADKFMTDDEIKKAIIRWRDESPMIVEFWGGQHRKHPTRWEFTPELFGLEGAAVCALLNPGQCYSYRGISYGVRDDVLYCRLPSGRCLAYHQPVLTPAYDDMRNVNYYRISFMGWNGNALTGSIGWRRIETYSGKLTENVVQATCRDLLTHAMPALEAAGYPIVLHVHDEVVCEVPTGYGSIEQFENIMKTPPPWAKDWPIKAAGGWRGLRYRK